MNGYAKFFAISLHMCLNLVKPIKLENHRETLKTMKKQKKSRGKKSKKGAPITTNPWPYAERLMPLPKHLKVNRSEHSSLECKDQS